ncbi:MAG: hypothetical protein ABI068_15135 [Ktedonobacterales bacterium]
MAMVITARTNAPKKSGTVGSDRPAAASGGQRRIETVASRADKPNHGAHQ